MGNKGTWRAGKELEEKKRDTDLIKALYIIYVPNNVIILYVYKILSQNELHDVFKE